MGLLDRLKAKLSKTRETLSDGISGLFRGGRAIDEDLLGELEEVLYTSDLGPVAAEVTEELARAHKRGEVKGEEDVRDHLRRVLIARLDERGGELELSEKPTVILVCGVNGSGKTTSIAKLGFRFREQGKSVLLGACDTFRAAAAEQLEIWAKRNGAEFVRGGDNADPASVAFDALDKGLARGVDVIVLDTAGRLHTQKNLMAELGKLQRVIAKRLPGAPHEVLLVIDATNGQNAIRQAREFTASVQVSGLIVAKLDGTARAGAIFTIQRELGIPVRYVGTGEALELLEPFDREAFVDALVSAQLTR
ncbi:MAG TPA: signal recognition particle-docking protein FtsY [Planctomycetota bacterium]|nr:signal recognition particle-docking protein FtsY [Planctomycetota bacterium]